MLSIVTFFFFGVIKGELSFMLGCGWLLKKWIYFMKMVKEYMWKDGKTRND